MRIPDISCTINHIKNYPKHNNYDITKKSIFRPLVVMLRVEKNVCMYNVLNYFI